jgi:hypothetical protein
MRQGTRMPGSLPPERDGCEVTMGARRQAPVPSYDPRPSRVTRESVHRYAGCGLRRRGPPALAASAKIWPSVIEKARSCRPTWTSE